MIFADGVETGNLNMWFEFHPLGRAEEGSPGNRHSLGGS